MILIFSIVASVEVEETTWTSIHLEWASISKRYNYPKKGLIWSKCTLTHGDWDIPMGAEKLYLALNNAVDKSCTVELQFNVKV